jgi:hypothetical protein
MSKFKLILNRIIKIVNYCWFLVVCLNLLSNILLLFFVAGFSFYTFVEQPAVINSVVKGFTVMFDKLLSNLIMFILLECFYIFYLKYLKNKFHILTLYLRIIFLILMIMSYFKLIRFSKFIVFMFTYSYKFAKKFLEIEKFIKIGFNSEDFYKILKKLLLKLVK